MTDEQINQAIAEACGWTQVNAAHRSGRAPNAEYVGSEFIPNYCADLNVMHEAEKTILKNHHIWTAYYYNIAAGTKLSVHATARKKAEAFLRALGKWEEVQR